MKKFIKFIVVALAIVVLMFAEYRIIMTNLHPHHGKDGHTIYIEFFGQVDEYDTLEPIKDVED